MTLIETQGTKGLKVKLRTGASVVKIRPIFTSDSKCLIIASGSDVKVYSIQSGECIHTLRFHETCIVSLQENKANYLQVYSCSEDGIVVRWDHSEGKLLQVYNVHMPSASIYIPKTDGPWFVTKKVANQDQFRLYSLTPKVKRSENIQMIISPVLPSENTVAYGCEGQFIAAVYENSLTVVKLDTKEVAKHLTGERTLKCVCCHPSDFVLATGDDQGRVLLWSNLLDAKNVIRSIYHWHTLPVADIGFSAEGSYLYSGGGEAALVKWNLFSDERSILPRLGAPICRLSVSRDNSFVVTAHNDNSLQIINSQRNVVQMIQGLTQGHFQGARTSSILPTGLLYDSHMKALILNGKPGHLQFYNIHEDKQLFNLDISGRNFISQERESIILNTDVQKAAVDEKGSWLATAEFWDDGETSPQIWLKFWGFDISKQTFVLNTNVILPHNKEVNCIVFRPYNNIPDNLPLAITTSNDCRFKIWKLKEDVCFDGKLSWTCESMGCYHDLPAGDASFSEDGSLLAVAFENVATLWTLDNTSLKAVLCNEKSRNKIKQLVFGRYTSCHLLMCQDGTSITVWDVLTLSITWIIHNSIQILVGDSTSDIAAAFCQDHSLVLFTPDNPKPINYVENVSTKDILSAIFVPAKEDDSNVFKTSELFLFDADQNLLTLIDEVEDIEAKKVTVHQNVPVTPFAMLQAENKVSNVQIHEQKPLVDISMFVNPDFEISCPTLMDPMMLCSKVLNSLLIPAQKKDI